MQYFVPGQKFDARFYRNWAENDGDDSIRDCGAVYAINDHYQNRLRTKTKNCHEMSPFVCEMTPKS